MNKIKVGVTVSAEKLTFEGKTLEEIKEIAKKMNEEERIKALEKEKE